MAGARLVFPLSVPLSKRATPRTANTSIIFSRATVLSLTAPFLHGLQRNSDYLHRLVVIFLTFSPIFIILTISYEGLFYTAFCIITLLWVQLEHRIHLLNGDTTLISDPARARSSPPTASANGTASPGPAGQKEQYRSLTLSDARIALFFLFLIQAAFFGTGNVGSLAAFSLESVYRLIPIFNPFSQGALLILKILIPFAVISANLGILNQRLHVAPSSLFMLVMAITDVLTVNFFWLVRDEGSWLDIGTTISHFCIASFLCVFVVGLEALSEVFTSGVRVGGEAAPQEGEGKGAENGAVGLTTSSGGNGGAGGGPGVSTTKSKKGKKGRKGENGHAAKGHGTAAS